MSTENTHVRDVLARLKSDGATTLTITYNGCGDEGFVEDTIAESASAIELDLAEEDAGTLADWAENRLEEIHPGWELNEGSSGQFTIDLAAETPTVEHVHHWPTVSTDTSTISLDAEPAEATLRSGGAEEGPQ